MGHIGFMTNLAETLSYLLMITSIYIIFCTILFIFGVIFDLTIVFCTLGIIILLFLEWRRYGSE